MCIIVVVEKDDKQQNQPTAFHSFSLCLLPACWYEKLFSFCGYCFYCHEHGTVSAYLKYKTQFVSITHRDTPSSHWTIARARKTDRPGMKRAILWPLFYSRERQSSRPGLSTFLLIVFIRVQTFFCTHRCATFCAGKSSLFIYRTHFPRILTIWTFFCF